MAKRKTLADKQQERDIQSAIDRLQIPILKIPALYKALSEAYAAGLRNDKLREFAVAWLANP